MEYLVTIHDINNIESLLKDASGLVVGLKGFSTRETSYLTTDEFMALSKKVETLNKNLFISLKPMLFNEQIKPLKHLFKELKDTFYSGVIVGDIGYYYLLKDLGVDNIIYHPETLLTNIMDINAFFEVGVKGAFVAKEIRLEDIKKMGEYKRGKLFMTVHGHLNMFYSKRKLLKNYFLEANEIYPFLDKDTLRLKELKRDGFYPIIEDEFGTHVFRKNVSTALYYKDELKTIDYLLIDSIFHNDIYTLEVLNYFKNGFDETLVEQTQKKFNELWDHGFLMTKTIYKREEK